MEFGHVQLILLSMFRKQYTLHSSSNYGGRFRLLKKAENPFKMGYDQELDTSPELEPDAYYLTVIGILRGMIKLGRIYIITKVSLLSSHVALSREGHLDAAVHVIITYVGQRYISRLMYDPLYPEIDHSGFKKCD